MSLGGVKQEQMLKFLLPGRPASCFFMLSVEVMACQRNEVPRFLSANRSNAERDRGGPGLGLHLPQEDADSSHGAVCAPGLQDSPFSGGWVTMELGQARQGREWGAGGEEELS